MKAVIWDGSKKGESNLEDIRNTLEQEINALGWDVEVFELRNLDISPCIGCFNCWIKTPGICTNNDIAGEVTRKMLQGDLLVLLTPVTFGGYSSEIKKALDRSLGIMLPYFTRIDGKIHHKKRYKIYPRLVAVGTLSKEDAEAEKIFKDLVYRNAINAHSPGHAAGVIVMGKDGETIRNEIRNILKMAGVMG